MLEKLKAVPRALAGSVLLGVLAIPVALLAVASVIAETVRTFRLALE